jgi:hypothetical protein
VNQEFLQKMGARQHFSNVWHTDLMGTPTADLPCKLHVFLCTVCMPMIDVFSHTYASCICIHVSASAYMHICEFCCMSLCMLAHVGLHMHLHMHLPCSHACAYMFFLCMACHLKCFKVHSHLHSHIAYCIRMHAHVFTESFLTLLPFCCRFLLCAVVVSVRFAC